MKKDNPTNKKIKELIKARKSQSNLPANGDFPLEEVESLCGYFSGRHRCSTIFGSIDEEDDILF